jgi:hypothetical protein
VVDGKGSFGELTEPRWAYTCGHRCYLSVEAILGPLGMAETWYRRATAARSKTVVLISIAGFCIFLNLRLLSPHLGSSRDLAQPSSFVVQANVGGQGGGVGKQASPRPSMPPAPSGWDPDKLQLISSHGDPMQDFENIMKCMNVTQMKMDWYNDDQFVAFMKNEWPQYYREFSALFNIAAKSDMFR